MKAGGEAFAARLRDELEERQTAGDLPEAMLRALEPRSSFTAAIGLSVGEMVALNVVNFFGSPSLLVRHGSFERPLSHTWADQLEPHRGVLEAMIPAVGRIEVEGLAGASWIGTGVLVAPSVVVTNRHVAVRICEDSGQGWVFKPGTGGAPMRARVDFLAEHQVAESAEFALTEVLAVENAPGPDLAFLRVAAGNGLPAPAVLGTSPAADDLVAAVGYTAREPGLPPEVEAALDEIFGGIYDVKRLAPGKTLRVTADAVAHDCSTLGGNSGSALVDVETARVVAVHFDGDVSENFAVPAEVVRARLDAVA